MELAHPFQLRPGVVKRRPFFHIINLILKITFKDYRHEMEIHPSCIEQEITPCEINEYFKDLVLITKVTEKMKQEISHFLCMLNRPMKISLFNIDSQVLNLKKKLYLFLGITGYFLG